MLLGPSHEKAHKSCWTALARAAELHLKSQLWYKRMQ